MSGTIQGAGDERWRTVREPLKSGSRMGHVVTDRAQCRMGHVVTDRARCRTDAMENGAPG
ncbi:MAG TPA: hypothetical protein DEV97_09660 [Lachnospiraceae bacterium]|nr:hypothetical protein [Lachnospiraceae bacterium]